MIESTSEGNTYSEVSSSLQHSELSESSTDLEISSSSLQHSELSESSTDLETSSSNLQHSELSESSTDLETSSSSSSLLNLHDSNFSSRQIGPFKTCLGNGTKVHDFKEKLVQTLRRDQILLSTKVYCFESTRVLAYEPARIPILLLVLEKMIFKGHKVILDSNTILTRENKKKRELIEEYKAFAGITNSDSFFENCFNSKVRKFYRCLQDFMEDKNLAEYCSSVDEATGLLKEKFENRGTEHELNARLLIEILIDILIAIFEKVDFVIPPNFCDIEPLLSCPRFTSKDQTSENQHFLLGCWRFLQHITIRVDSRRVFFWQNFFNHYEDRFELDQQMRDIYDELWQRIGNLDTIVATKLESETAYKKHIECFLSQSKLKHSQVQPIGFEYNSELTGITSPRKPSEEYCTIIPLRDIYYKGQYCVASTTRYVGVILSQMLISNKQFKKVRLGPTDQLTFLVESIINEASKNYKYYTWIPKKKANFDIACLIECQLEEL